MSTLIAPHGGKLVETLATDARMDQARRESEKLPRLTLSAKQSCDLEMLTIGAFSPLAGFMGAEDFERVCKEMKLATGSGKGLVWPIPIVLAVKKDQAPGVGERVALHAPNGVLQAIMTIKEEFLHDKKLEVPNVFRTEDPAHPGVKAVMDEGEVCLAGPVESVMVCVDPDGPEAFLDHRLTPRQTREEFHKRGWKTVCAFQTRNPIHRAHEYLCKVAQEICDGLLVHPLVGETKPGDIPAAVRMECYKVLLDKYFVHSRTMLSVMPAAMRYAGPREAILHAIVRKNYGCTHFIVGRDHAGVGNYYGSYDAQNIFDQIEHDPSKGGLGMTIFKFEHTAWSKLAGGMVSPKSFPKIEGDQISLSGTAVRDMLAKGERPPVEFTRPEVADVLIKWAKGGK
ncbi:MAG: sulfate adenylyltransferase [Phycisphaerae bacterium]|nr:sulfate adenylyltransferase [Phycisphaerae bacterium]